MTIINPDKEPKIHDLIKVRESVYTIFFLVFVI